MAVFCVAAPCSLVEVYQRFRCPCCLHHQGNEDLWNVGKLLPDHMALQPRRQPSLFSPPWELQILPRKLPIKNDGRIANSKHLYFSMVILFLTRLSNPWKDIFEVIITKNSDFKKWSPTIRHIYFHIYCRLFIAFIYQFFNTFKALWIYSVLSAIIFQ
jgi:hypothetical protein